MVTLMFTLTVTLMFTLTVTQMFPLTVTLMFPLTVTLMFPLTVTLMPSASGSDLLSGTVVGQILTSLSDSVLCLKGI